MCWEHEVLVKSSQIGWLFLPSTILIVSGPYKAAKYQKRWGKQEKSDRWWSQSSAGWLFPNCLISIVSSNVKRQVIVIQMWKAGDDCEGDSRSAGGRHRPLGSAGCKWFDNILWWYIWLHFMTFVDDWRPSKGGARWGEGCEGPWAADTGQFSYFKLFSVKNLFVISIFF